jgi:hypothetical protein
VTVVAYLALFVALGGTALATTQTFTLGTTNRVDAASTVTNVKADNTQNAISSPLLVLQNLSTGGFATALQLKVASGHAPFFTNSATKVTNLNADQLDSLDSSAFLRRGVLQTNNVTAAGGVVDVNNTGTTNGVQGKTSESVASGVYGQNDGGGFGVAGRSNNAGGTGVYGEALGGTNGVSALSDGTGGAVRAENDGSGPALELHSAGAPMTVDSSAKVANLNADKVDGASIVSNRVVTTTQDTHILDIPGFGFFKVDLCDHTNTRWIWTPNGTGNAYVTATDLANPTDGTFQGPFPDYTSFARPRKYDLVQLARNTGSTTSIAQVTLTTNAEDCVFAASAVVQPG